MRCLAERIEREPVGSFAVAIAERSGANLQIEEALGAAYTPVSIGPDGKIYTQNFGHMIVAGAAP